MSIFFIFFIIAMTLWWMDNRRKRGQFSILGSLGSLAKIALALFAVYAVFWVIIAVGATVLLHNAPGAFHPYKITQAELNARIAGNARGCAQKFPIYRDHYNQQLVEHYISNNNMKMTGSSYYYDVKTDTCLLSYNMVDADGNKHFVEMDTDYRKIKEW